MFACSELLELSDAFIDDELFPEARAWVLDHLRDCGDCSELVEKKAGLKRLVRTSVRQLTAPASLRQTLRVHIGAKN
jgi:Putative zinc-finger